MLKMADWPFPTGFEDWLFKIATLDSTQMKHVSNPQGQFKFSFDIVKTFFFYGFAALFLFLLHPTLQVQTATRTQQWYQRDEKWRLTSAQSATAHTRKARGKSSVRPPVVRMSVRGTRETEETAAPRFSASWTSGSDCSQQSRISNHSFEKKKKKKENSFY